MKKIVVLFCIATIILQYVECRNLFDDFDDFERRLFRKKDKNVVKTENNEDTNDGGYDVNGDSNNDNNDNTDNSNNNDNSDTTADETDSEFVNNGFFVTIRGKKYDLCNPKVLKISSFLNSDIQRTLKRVCTSGGAGQFIKDYAGDVDFNNKLPKVIKYIEDSPSESRLSKFLKYLGKRANLEWTGTDEFEDVL